MNATRIKFVTSTVIAMMIILSVPLIGFTTASTDSKQGLMIDYGYWDVVWTEMTFTDKMNGYDVLDGACHIQGYEYVVLDDGVVYSVNGQVNLIGVKWAMYVLSGDKWAEADPYTVKASEHNILCWSRSSGADMVIPGVDATGYSYYSYGSGGNGANGEKLRVVTLAPSATETLACVGGVDRIVGTDLYSNYPQEIVDGRKDGSIATIGGYTDPNFEWIIDLAPDIVFCDGGTGEHVAMAEKLRRSYIDCVVLYEGTDIGMLYNNIWIVASALGMSERANTVIQELRTSIDVVSGIAGMSGNKRVFVALSDVPSPWTAGHGTFITDVIANAGGRGLFDQQSSSWFMVTKEQIYKRLNVIIILSKSNITEDGYWKMLNNLDQMWKQTPAFQNGEIYIFSGEANDMMQRPGPRLGEAVEIMGKILIPEAFLLRDPIDVIPKYFDDSYRDYLTYSGGISS